MFAVPVSLLSFTFVLCAYLHLKKFWCVLFYHFYAEMFSAGCAAVSNELRTILRNKICKILHYRCGALLFLRTTANSVQNSAIPVTVYVALFMVCF